jgi:hypothetical protein
VSSKSFPEEEDSFLVFQALVQVLNSFIMARKLTVPHEPSDEMRASLHQAIEGSEKFGDPFGLAKGAHEKDPNVFVRTFGRSV